MSKVTLVTDSTTYLPKELVAKYGIKVAPQLLIWGEKTFLDGVDIQPSEFYTRLKTAKTMPSSSQATPKIFHEIFKAEVEAGNSVLAILISEVLSGTIASAIQAREMLPGATIEIVDSRTTSMAMGFTLLAAARALEDGASLAEAKAMAEKAREHVGVVFAVDTLEFLHRGGRIGGANRFLGTALNIKPILEVTGGKVEGIEKVRTRSKSLNRVIEIIGERIGGRTPVRLATLHANAPEEAKMVLEEAKKQFNAVESIASEVSPVVGTHAGPGTVGLAFMAGM
ncbi:MAG: DegV family protein [Anaerolineales bacterium]|jgi:DegV family protein with EDD domain|nr:DegV family protein [Anaerolineales bacterium]